MDDGTPQEQVATAAKKKRPLHTSVLTAIVVLVALNGFAWLVIRPHPEMRGDLGCEYSGWPLTYGVLLDVESYSALGLDVLIIGAILVCLVFICECLAGKAAGRAMPRLQIRLPTAIFLMFVASGLLWAAMQPGMRTTLRFDVPPGGSHQCQCRVFCDLRYGWPRSCYFDAQISNWGEQPFVSFAPNIEEVEELFRIVGKTFDLAELRKTAPALARHVRQVADTDRGFRGCWDAASTALDIFVAFSILFAVAILLEWRIRRRERRP